MKENNFNPNDVVSRALLLMKYDSNKTLTENQSAIKTNLINEDGASAIPAGGAGLASAVVAGGAATGAATANVGAAAGVLNGVTSFPGFFAALANPLGVSVLVVTGVFLWGMYRNADNEEKLRITYKACKAVKSKGYYDELNRNMALKPSEVKLAALLYYQSQQGAADVFDQGWGSDKGKARKANAIMKKGNLADICVMMLKYQGEDFADEMAEEFDEYFLAEIVDTFDNAVDEYAGGGNKIIPEDSYNINWYKENFGCIFRSKDVWVKEHGVKIDNDGYTYVVIKGLKRTDTSGRPYQKLYRLYGDEARITTVKDKTGNVKDTNATLRCASANNPVAVIQGGEEQTPSLEESRINKYPTKRLINEIFDDRDIKVVSGDVLDDKTAGWEEGKKVAPWPHWLVKYPCLKVYHPNATPEVDNMGYTYFINLNPKNNKKYRFYSDGEIWLEDGSKFIGKNWSCPQRGGSVLVESFRKRLMEQIPFDIEGETDVPKVEPIKTVVEPIKTVVEPAFTECKDLPLKKGCKGSKVGEVQACLGGIKVDNKFGSETEKAISSKYNTTTVDQSTYDKIIADCKKTPVTPPVVDPNVDPKPPVVIDPTLGSAA